MRTRYIDADYLLREISFYADRPTKAAMKTIKEIALHPANVVERKRGKWEVCGTFDDFLKCTCCGYKKPWNEDIFNFCPDCGADMREKTDAEVR